MRAARVLRRAIPFCAAVVGPWLISGQSAEFVPLRDLPGGDFFSAASGVSSDGEVVVGHSKSELGKDGEAFVWRRSTGMQPLGDFEGGQFQSRALAVSAQGGAIVGVGESANGTEAFRWSANEGIVGLGDLAGGNFYSEANDISDDGMTIVGTSSSAMGPRGEAFRWTPTDGLVGLGDLPGGEFYSQATAVSDNGQKVVGGSFGPDYPNGTPRFRSIVWTVAGGMREFGEEGTATLPTSMGAQDVSSDGKLVVGQMVFDSYPQAYQFRSQERVGTPLGRDFLPETSQAVAVSTSGDTVVGRIFGERNGEPVTDALLVEDLNVYPSPMTTFASRRLRDVLVAEFGLGNVLDGWRLTSATGVSAEGAVIVGEGINPTGHAEAWLVDLRPFPGDANLDRRVDLNDFGLLKGEFGQQVKRFHGSDFDGSGEIGLADFGLLKANFGASPEAQAVPEPPSWALLLATLTLLGLARRRGPWIRFGAAGK